MKPQSFFIDSTDGKLKVFTTPMPTKEKFTTHHGYTSGDVFPVFHEDMYNREIELAKKEAVEVEGQRVTTGIGENSITCIYKNKDGLWCIDWQLPDRHELASLDKIYTINMEEEIKVFETSCNEHRAKNEIECTNLEKFHPDCCGGKKLARIIPKKAETNIEKLDALTSNKESGWMQKAIERKKADTTCSACWGSGWETQFITPCRECNGTGHVIPKKAEESEYEIREAIISILEESWDTMTPMPTPFMFDFMALLKANGFEIKRKA